MSSQGPSTSSSVNGAAVKPLEQKFVEIKDAMKEGDNDKIKKIIHSFDPPDASYDDIKVKLQRTKVFKYALRLNDFPVVEMLYDYWSGDLHWIGHDKIKLETLGQLLEDARVVCEVKNERLLIGIHSLITFNAFQQTLYSKISGLPNTTPKETASMLVEVLSLYDTYSDLEKIRIPEEVEEQERKLKANFADQSSEYMKGLAYIKYDVYFRKLDFNVAFLILENLIVFRQELKNKFNQSQETNQGNSSFKDEADKYKDIECALYHFIYRTAEDWRLYLPPNRQLTTETHVGIHKNKIIEDLIVTYDEYKVFNAPVLFLERKYFSKNLNELKMILEKHIINCADLDETNQNAINLNDHYLTPTYMSDYYSLSKIVYYIGAIENAGNDVLIIERVLQVTGEMIKSSGETNHLLESTKSLLQIGIPVDTIRYLQTIREYLSHYRGHLSKRIDIAKKQAHIYFDDNIKNELKHIKNIINSIRDIYKPILDKSMLEHGLRLLDERIENLPDEALRHLDLFHQHYEELVNENDFLFKEIRAYTDLTTQLIKEIICILAIKVEILSKINKLKTTISEKVEGILPTYIEHIRRTQKLMNENQKNVKKLNSQLRQYNITPLSDNPNMQEINLKKRDVIKNSNKEFNEDLFQIQPQILQSLGDIKDYSRNNQALWSCLKYVCKLLPLKVPEDSTVDNILAELKIKCKLSSSCNNLLPTNYSFHGIKKLHDIFEEKKTGSTQDNNWQQSLPQKKLISCLSSRMNLLKNNLQVTLQIPLKDIAPSPSDQLLLSYKDNLKFRFELEMILSDIANILVHCKINNLMNKSSKLLREINLRNVLGHGNTFLDVIGDIFDSYDLSTELLSKAIMFAKDGESIEALLKLIEVNVDYDTIKNGKLEEMNEKQKEFYEQFQRSPRWENYVELVPKPDEDNINNIAFYVMKHAHASLVSFA